MNDTLAPATLSDANLNDVHDLLYKQMDYMRRIHWWVRLAGIIWIGIPAAAALFAVVAVIAGGLA